MDMGTSHDRIPLTAGITKIETTLADGRDLVYYDDANSTLGDERAADLRQLPAHVIVRPACRGLVQCRRAGPLRCVERDTHQVHGIGGCVGCRRRQAERLRHS